MITPLISGMFDLQRVKRDYPGNAQRATIGKVSEDGLLPSSRFSYVTYNYLFENAPLPAFTTPDYTLLPVRNVTRIGNANETWEVESTLFEAELICETVNVFDISNPVDGIQFLVNWELNWTICETPMDGQAAPDCSEYLPLNVTWASFNARQPSTKNNTDRDYLFAWLAVNNPSSDTQQTSDTQQNATQHAINITAIHCMAQYYSQPVTAHVKMPSGEIETVDRTGTRDVFDIIPFSNLIDGMGGAVSYNINNTDGDGGPAAFGTFSLQLANIDSQLQRKLGQSPIDPDEAQMPVNFRYKSDERSHSIVYITYVKSLSALILASRTKDNIGEFLDPAILTASYQQALKLWFAFAIAIEMVDQEVVESVPVVRQVDARGFVVDDLSARGTQCCLAIVVLLVGAITWLIGSRVCNLDGEPNSLAEALRLLSTSPELIDHMQNAEYYSPQELSERFAVGSAHYFLTPGEQGPQLRRIDVLLQDGGLLEEVTNEKPKPLQPWKQKLWALRTGWGVGFICGTGLILVILTAVFIISRIQEGKTLQYVSFMISSGANLADRTPTTRSHQLVQIQNSLHIYPYCSWNDDRVCSCCYWYLSMYDGSIYRP